MRLRRTLPLCLSLLLLLHGVTPFLGPYSHPVM